MYDMRLYMLSSKGFLDAPGNDEIATKRDEVSLCRLSQCQFLSTGERMIGAHAEAERHREYLA